MTDGVDGMSQGGSHAIYAISSVRNEESLVIDGPNPFGEVRDAPWGPVLADGDVQPVLLPADAELDPVAVARLKLGADLTLEQLQEMQVAGDDEAPQPSGTSPVEALIPDVHPDPWSLPGDYPAPSAPCNSNTPPGIHDTMTGMQETNVVRRGLHHFPIQP